MDNPVKIIEEIIMPGRICIGEATGSKPRLASSRAFCEGMAYRASGTLVQRPFSDNPHVQSSEDWNAWDNGWTLADDATGGNISKADLGCCAATPVIPA